MNGKFVVLAMTRIGLGILALLVCSSIGLVGCNKEDATNLQRDTGKLVSTASESLKNATVAVKVNTVLSLRKGVDMSGFKVESKGGVVTIVGSVRSIEEKRLVLETAMGVRGVDKVVDKLEVVERIVK